MPTRKRIQTSQPKEVTGGDTIIVESGDVDASWEVDVVITDDPIIVSLEMPDTMDHSDLLVVGPASLDDSIDTDDTMSEVTGTITPDEALMFEPAPIITDLTIPDPLILVNEPPSLNPDVADFYYLHPRIADSVASVGEVVKFDPVGRGHLELTSVTATKFRQIRQDDTGFSGVVTVGNFTTGVNNDIRADNNLVGTDNARWVIASWDLQVGGVRWGKAQHPRLGLPYIQLSVLNESTLSSAPFSLSAFLTTNSGSVFDPTKNWSWSNTSVERSIFSNAAPGNGTDLERVDGTADTASLVTGPTTTDIFVAEPFNIAVTPSNTTTLVMAAWQETAVLTALELRVNQHMIAQLQFEIEG